MVIKLSCLEINRVSLDKTGCSSGRSTSTDSARSFVSGCSSDGSNGSGTTLGELATLDEDDTERQQPVPTARPGMQAPPQPPQPP